jgi:eukaryotic-like serine/threonine-protein kinase
MSTMDVIGKYKVIKKLGEGATSAVYLAEDPFTARKVAIKLMFPSALKDSADGAHYRQMFLNEAALAGKMDHPHIVGIQDAVVADDMSYIVMEYVEGGTLEKYVSPDNLLGPQVVAEIIFKAIRALDFASSQGLIHRDIKPGNILHKSGTDIKIGDFGAAVKTSANANAPVVGSPLYMAPEVIAGGESSMQSDIYALGMVMYMLLAGRPPYEATSHESLAYQILNHDPEPPSRFREGISAPMEDIVKQAIAKDTKRRYQNWEEFGRDLSEIWKSEHTPQKDRGEVSDTERFGFLKQLSFFRNFPENELWEVVRISKWRAFAPNTTLIKEGDEGDSFFIIAEGTVRITRSQKLLNILSAGDCVGEMSYLATRSGPRSATVTTASPSVLMKIPAAELNAASESCRALFDRKFLATLVERLETANQRLTVT